MKKKKNAPCCEAALMRMSVACWMLWLTVPAACGVATFCIAMLFLDSPSPTPVSVDSGTPRIEYSSRLDLGEHEYGAMVTGRVSVANRGGGVLVIDQIRTDCSCSGLEREDNGQFYRIETLRLRGGEEANLAIRVRVRGAPIGSTMVNTLEFRTNDPNQPIGRIEAAIRRVHGGVYTVPEAILVGTVPIGANVRHTFDVWDRAVAPRAIERIVSSQPDLVHVRVVPRDSIAHPPNTADSAHWIARMEVEINTSYAGNIDATIGLQLTGEQRPPNCIPVSGRVAPPIELSPRVVVLPRRPSTGQIYEAIGRCVSHRGDPLTLEVTSLPMGVSVEIIDREDPSYRILRVALDPKIANDTAGMRRWVVQLRARAGNDESLIEWHIHCGKHGEADP